jgi:membrane protein YdbS with pleckstrin-like domain
MDPLAWQSGGVSESAPALRLRPPANRVSRAAIWYWTARAAASWLVILGVQIVWLVTGPSYLALHLAVLALSVVVAAVHVAVMPHWRYRIHRWESTPDAVYTQSGWFTQERRLAPISRIQTVDSHRGPIEQLFGLANVTVTTASAAGPLLIEGLDVATAEALVAELTATAQAAPGDAT